MSKGFTQKGFSLVEAIISISVLLVGVMAVVSLGIAMVTQARLTNTQVVASQLAREGVEVVRAIRDGNWLTAEDGGGGNWNDTLSSGTDYSMVLHWDSILNNTWTVNFDATDFGNCSTGFDCTRMYANSNPPYDMAQFASVPPANYVATPYQRLLRLFPICRSLTDETVETFVTSDGVTCSSGTEEQVGIDIQVEVRWEEKGITRSTMVEEHIYDWKY